MMINCIHGIPNEQTQNFGSAQTKRILMEQYGSRKSIYGGVNDNNEHVLVAISKNRIEVTTFQKNGWTRINEYDADGAPCGESYKGRWRCL